MIEDKIRQVIEDKLTEEGFEDCYIISITISQNSKVRVFIDCDSGVPIRKCVSISRRVEHYLDETLLIGEKYVLEISSAGIDNPLVKRQYKKNIGRDLSVKLDDNTKIKGTLVEVDENGIVLDISTKKEKKQLDIKFEDILEAKVIVKFNKKKK